MGGEGWVWFVVLSQHIYFHLELLWCSWYDLNSVRSYNSKRRYRTSVSFVVQRLVPWLSYISCVVGPSLPLPLIAGFFNTLNWAAKFTNVSLYNLESPKKSFPYTRSSQPCSPFKDVLTKERTAHPDGSTSERKLVLVSWNFGVNRIKYPFNLICENSFIHSLG